ncbi:MAG: hypothetical protein ACT4PE_09150 [Candidatus Eiseniibacteriota bacterium]
MLWMQQLLGCPAAVLLTIGGTTPAPPDHKSREFLTWQTEQDVAYRLSQCDAAQVMLLDERGIFNLEDWRGDFDRQVMGDGVRSEVVDMLPASVERLKSLLLEPTHYVPGDKLCLISGDAALLFRGPQGEVEVMLELWCSRVHFRIATGCRLIENVDPVQTELIGIVRRHFPGDEYLARLKP